MSFAKNIPKNKGKNISKNLSSKYGPGMLAARHKLLDYAKYSLADAFKTASKRAIQKITEATGGLIGNKIAKNITKVSKNSKQNNYETFTNEDDK